MTRLLMLEGDTLERQKEARAIGVRTASETQRGQQLTQSLAILNYLDKTFPKPSLLPKDPILRAQIRGASLVIVLFRELETSDIFSTKSKACLLSP